MGQVTTKGKGKLTTVGHRTSVHFRQLLTKANKAERRGNPRDCIDACQRILAEQPSHPRALALLGLSALQLGDFQTGIGALQQAVAADPANVSAFVNLGKALAHIGNLTEAENALQDALAADPADVDAHMTYAIILETGDRFIEAKEHYLFVTGKRPKSTEAWLGLGNTQKASGDLVEAKESFEREVELQPKFASAHHNLGSILLELNDNEAAIDAFRRTIDLEAGRADSWFNLGIALQKIGDLDDAINAFEKARDIDPDNAETLYSLGISLKDLMRYDEAISSFQRAIEIRPDYIDALNNLAIALNALQRDQEAIEYYQRVIKIRPDSAESHINLGRCLSIIGRVEESAVAYETALNFCETSKLRAEALCNLSKLPNSTISVDLLASIDEISVCDLDTQIAEDSESFRTRLAFARAQALDKLGRHKEAWDVLVDANRCLNSSYGQDHVRSLEENEKALKAAFNWGAKKFKADFVTTNNPISLFILGPSRSGKSSLEKLLSGLDGVQCGYETTIFDNVIFQVSRTIEPSNLAMPGYLPDELSSKVSELYSTELHRRAGQASVFTNTYPGHIYEVGGIAVNVPAARFIFVNRNQEDTALRIFMEQYLEDTNYYAYQIDNIFSHISWYQQMSDVWMDKLPNITMALSYENMVADPKGSLAKVAEFCGLPAPKGNPPDPGDDRGCAEPYLKFLNDVRG